MLSVFLTVHFQKRGKNEAHFWTQLFTYNTAESLYSLLM